MNGGRKCTENLRGRRSAKNEERRREYTHCPNTQRATPDHRLEGLEHTLCTPPQEGCWEVDGKNLVSAFRGEGAVATVWTRA